MNTEIGVMNARFDELESDMDQQFLQLQAFIDYLQFQTVSFFRKMGICNFLPFRDQQQQFCKKNQFCTVGFTHTSN